MKIKSYKSTISDIKNVLIEIDKINWKFSNLSGNQLQLFKGLDATQLQTYLTQLQAAKLASKGVFDTTAVSAYANAVQGLEAKQAALLLSTQGLTNAQIAETLAVNESNMVKNYQAMVDAGLLVHKQKLTLAQIQENLQTVLGAEADTSAAMASLGLSAAIEGQEHQTVQLTTKKIQEAVATNVLTQAQAQEFAMRTGVILSMQRQTVSVLPKWIATVKAATIAVLGQVKATAVWMATNPVGWITAAVATIGGAVWAYKEFGDTVENAKEKVEDAAEKFNESTSELENIETELSNIESKIKELEALDSLTWVEQEELNRLREVTKELELQKQIKRETQLQTAEDLFDANKHLFEKEYKYFNLDNHDSNVRDIEEGLNTGRISVGQIDFDNIDDAIGTLRFLQKEKEKLLTDDTITTELQSQIDEYDEFMEDIKHNFSETLSSLSEYKQNILEIASIRDLTEDEQSFYDYLSSMQKAIYEYYSPATWNNLEFDSIFDTAGIEKTKDELVSMYKSGELSSAEMLEQFPKLNEAIRQSEIIAGESSDVYKEFFNEIASLADEQAETVSDIAQNTDTYSIDTYKDQIDDIQSSISTLRDALDSFNAGTLDESTVIDLMQQFPALIPYIDLTADGFGNLSEGLSELIAQQPDSLIQSLETLKDSLNTDEERAQVDALINSLQALSSYGDTGMEAYATSVGSTWIDTANVIESVTTQFENLAKVQETVAEGLTMSATAAAELAKMYPDILTNAEYAGNGQIALNQEVVNSILAGDQSIIDAQIAKLEADKAELTAKKSFAEAQLEIVKQVGKGEGDITREVAQYRIDAANSLLEALIQAGVEEDKAYAAVTENMAGNTDEFNRIVGEVAQDISANMDAAAVSMAESISINAINSQNSFKEMQNAAWKLAESIKAAANGERSGNEITPSGGGSTAIKNINAKIHSGDFTRADIGNIRTDKLELDDFQSNLELDIKGYTDAISNIDSQIEVLKNLQLTFDNNGGIGGHGYADKIKELEKEKDKINKALDDSKGSSKDTKDEYEELFDFFERRVSILDDALSLLKTNMDNVTGSFAKNNLIDAELGITGEKFNNYADALAMYSEKANEALSKLPSDIAAKIKDGAVGLTTFIGDGNEEVVDAIEDYKQWADKISDCKQELAELKTAIRELELEKFNNIMEDFNNQFDLHEDGKDLISKQIDLLKEAGQLIGESFFTTQIDQSKKQLEILEAEKTELVQQMSSAVSSGKVQKSSKEWLEMVNALSDVEGNILDCKKAIEEFDNELLQLHWEVFERVQTQFDNISSELGNLAGLFDDFNDIRVSDGKGTWTKEAIATMGLYAQQYELAQYQVQQYNDAINKLNADYSDGKYSATEYMDKLSDLSKEQWDAVNSAESLEDAIYDLNETRVNEEIQVIEDEIDAYKKLIDAQIDALKAAKDLHDYQQSIAEKTKSITDLERQIAAMQNDNTAATVAKRKQLEEQLADAKADLEDAEYDHSIEEQENALNKQYEQFEEERNKEIEALRKTLEDKEALIAQSFETVKANADLVGQEIAVIATQHGITVSDAIITSWQNGENAIASYGQTLSAGSSAFIGNIMGVENEVYALQTQANVTADSLSYMFATRADNLVNELLYSYCSEENLNAMTNALQDSLINTLERGYNVSSIINSLDSIASSANSVASAANNAADALARMGAAQSAAQSVQSSTSGSSSSIKFNDKKAAVKTTDYIGTKLKAKNAYASGTRNAKGGLRIVNEEGAELTLPKLSSGNYAIGNAGDQILTKEQTDKLIKWSQLTPQEFWAEYTAQNPELCRQAIEQSIPSYIKAIPEIISSSTNNTSVNVHYGSLVTVNGDVNDTKHFLNDMKNVANDAIKKSWHDFEMTRKYGSY